MKEIGKCSINPKHTYKHYGNNAEPVNSGRCCDFCNDTVVIPARLANRNGLSAALLGASKSMAKTLAARENGKKGGRPKKVVK